MLYNARSGACIPLPNMGPCSSSFAPPAAPYAPMFVPLPMQQGMPPQQGMSMVPYGGRNDTRDRRHSRPRSHRRRSEPRRRSRGPRRTSRRSRPRFSALGRGQARHRRHSHHRRSPSRSASRRPSSPGACTQCFRAAGARAACTLRQPSPCTYCFGLWTWHSWRPPLSRDFVQPDGSTATTAATAATKAFVAYINTCKSGHCLPALGHAKEVANLFAHHLHHGLCHDSGLHLLTTHLQLHTYMDVNKLIIKAGETPWQHRGPQGQGQGLC